MTTIPQTAAEFKAWADRECIWWPPALTAEAYTAWTEMLRDRMTKHQEFTASHGEWAESR